MNTRYLSLDALRGLSIFGMTFCYLIPSAPKLPGWMYHIFPSPGWTRGAAFPIGISWVDLVLPIFVFCMGVAIPFSGRRKLEKGLSGGKFMLEILERTLMLWMFAYLYVFLSFTSAKSDYTWLPQLLTVAGFLALFPIYLVLKPAPYVKWLRLGGAVVALGLIVVNHEVFAKNMTIGSRGMIIFLLSGLYLIGATLWYVTRNSFAIRAGVVAALTAFMLFMTQSGYSEALGVHKTLKAFFDYEFFFFQLILLPATFVGDRLYERIILGKQTDIIPDGAKLQYVLFPMFAVLAAWECYAFYERLVWAHIAVTGLALGAMFAVVRTAFPKYQEMFLFGAVLLMVGIFIDPFEGIKKVPCTISYCFATAGISVFLLMMMDFICKHIGRSLPIRMFTGAGCNPLMSYIAHGAFTVPMLKLTGLITYYNMLYTSGMNPWLGVGRALIAVTLTMSIVAFLSEKKITWKA